MMKTIFVAIFALALPFLAANSSQASDIVVNAEMQVCSTNEECTLVSNSCAQSCGFVPANKAIVKIIEDTYFTKCGKVMESSSCTVTPPIAAMCVNGRCTLDVAYKETATPKDYQSGAYAVPEAPAPNKVEGDFSSVDDRNGKFSAYNLPQEQVQQKTVGQIIDKIYVPADAPVKGEQYIAIEPKPSAPNTPPQIAPPTVAPIAPSPQPQTLMAPAVQKPVAPVAPPATTPPVMAAPTPSATPKMVEQPAIPMSDVPVMRPTKPNQSYEATQKPVQPPVYPVEKPVVSAPMPSGPDDKVLSSPDTTSAPQAILPSPEAGAKISPPAPQAELTPMIDTTKPPVVSEPSAIGAKKPADDKKSFGSSNDKTNTSSFN